MPAGFWRFGGGCPRSRGSGKATGDEEEQRTTQIPARPHAAMLSRKKGSSPLAVCWVVMHRASILVFALCSVAAGWCQQSAPATSQPDTNVSQPAPTVAVAQQKLAHGDAAGAIAMLQPLAAAHPPANGAARVLGIAYYRTGKLLDALQAFKEAEKQDPKDMESVQMLGLTLYRLGRPADAIPYLERVRQWMPNADADANHVLGLCYLNARQYDAARKTFALQYGVSGDSGAAYLLLAQMLLQANLPELAKTAAEHALTLTPNLPLANFAIGEVDLFKSDPNGALTALKAERAINPAYPETYERLGDVYLRLGQYQQAQESLTRALSLTTASTGPFILMGKTLLRRKDPKTAAMYLQHAEKMDPGNYITHTLLSQAYRAMGDSARADKEMDAASKIHAASQLTLQPVR